MAFKKENRPRATFSQITIGLVIRIYFRKKLWRSFKARNNQLSYL